jgi:hypothetical protein
MTDNNKKENWQDYYKKQNEKQKIKKEKQKNKQKTYLGWIALLLAFSVKGTIVALILSIYALLNKKHDNTIATVALIFSIAILSIYLFVIFF